MSPKTLPSNERRLLAYSQSAEYLGISLRTMKDLAANGEIRKVQIRGRVLFDRADLDGYIERIKKAS